MTTQRLYYTDSYTMAFDARVIERTRHDNAPAVILDRSYFYPSSGGQPHDTGTLNAVAVRDVVIRESDQAVLHVLEADLPDDDVSGHIDWQRRLDHMQHHTGQHVLTQAFIRAANAETISFHLSPDSVTIDLNTPSLGAKAVDAAEDLANQIIAENRPVRAWYPEEDEISTLPLRKVPDDVGKLRVIAVQDFDVTACGGTHVAHTGEIALIKVLKTERRGDTTRVEFCCGTRALHDYRAKHALLSQLAAQLTTGYADIPDILDKLREENKALKRDMRTLQTALLESEADALWRNGVQREGYTLVIKAFDQRDVGDVRQIVQHLIAHPATIALCGASGVKAMLMAARSDDLPHDMVPVLKQGLAVWDITRGGGRPSFAQGGGAQATIAQVEAALAAAASNL
jgi:alanyl-tRNA synthetase